MDLSLNKLSLALGCTKQRIWYHKNKYPEKVPKTHDVEEWKAYFGAEGRVAGVPLSNKSPLNPLKPVGSAVTPSVNERMAKTKLEILEQVRHDKTRSNRIKDNLIFDADEVKQFVTRLVAFFFAELDRLSQEYPVTLKGRTEIPINEECVRQNKMIKAALQDRVDQWETEHKRTLPK